MVSNQQPSATQAQDQSQETHTPAALAEPGWLEALRTDLLELAEDPAVQQYGSAAYFAWRHEMRLRLAVLLEPNREWREVVLREFDMLSFPGPPQEWPARLMVLGNYLTGLLFTLARLGQDLEFNEANVHKLRLGFHPPEVTPAEQPTATAAAQSRPSVET